MTLSYALSIDAGASPVRAFMSREPTRIFGSLRRATQKSRGGYQMCTEQYNHFCNTASLVLTVFLCLLFVFSLVPAQFASAHVDVGTVVQSVFAVSLGANVMHLLTRQHVAA
jgi:hypothetical protein